MRIFRISYWKKKPFSPQKWGRSYPIYMPQEVQEERLIYTDDLDIMMNQTSRRERVEQL